MVTRMYDGIHVYTRRPDGTIEHRINDNNDIELTIDISDSEIEDLQGWPTPTMRTASDWLGQTILVGCDDTGRVIEANR